MNKYPNSLNNRLNLSINLLNAGRLEEALENIAICALKSNDYFVFYIQGRI